MSQWMLYGAYGYTGRVTIEVALARGHKPLLAGRNEAKLTAVAQQYNLDYVTLDLNNTSQLCEEVSKVSAVVHMAGPFSQTCKPMLNACLQGKTHYLDITGEIPVFQTVLAHDKQAKAAGICLISGVGFDIVPTDCLGAYVASQVENAQSLDLAFTALSGISGGTSKTLLEMAGSGGFVRRNGRLLPHKLGTGNQKITFSNGKTYTVTPIPWGDLATAQKSTGCVNVTTSMTTPMAGLMRATPFTQPLFRIPSFVKAGQWLIDKLVDGPSEKTRQTARAYLWAKAVNDIGDSYEAWLETIEPYQFTAVASVQAVEKVLAKRPLGALTPSLAFGADFILEIEGSKRLDQIR